METNGIPYKEKEHMPLDILTTADNVRVQGSLTVINDPAGNAGNVNIGGTLVVSGTTSFASSAVIGGAITASSGLAANGFIASGGTTPTASSQSASSASTPITMTSGIAVNGPNIVYVQASGTSTASILLTPTASTSTSGLFKDGAEITMINSSPSGSRLAIPSGNFGSFNVASIVVSEGRAMRFKYIAALQAWVPLQGA